MTDNTWHTAIKRNKISLPSKIICNHKLMIEPILDYGCGRSDDVNILKYENYDITGYDPYFASSKPLSKFKTVLCHYVLNVVDDSTISMIISDLKSYCDTGGNIFITVRRDINNDYESYPGVIQRNIVLEDIEIFYETCSFCIYILRR